MEEGRSELVIKYLQGQLDTQGINDFYTWVNENVENKKVFFEIKAVYDACYTNRMQNDMEGSWDRLLKKRKVFYPRKKSRWLQLGNYAAVSFITVCLTSLFLTFNKDEDKIATRYIGGDGLDADVVELPDGTQVCLGSKTVFHYENDYGRKERTVYLEGEAYFEVARNHEKPFMVKSPAIDVRVLGTSFNIKCRPDNSFAETTLIEGEVEVKDKSDKGRITLLPGQKAVLNRVTGRMQVKQVDPKMEIVWHNDLIPFEKSSIFQIAAALERFYGVKIILSPDVDSTNTYSGVLKKKDNIESVLNSLRNSIPFNYKKVDDNNIFISSETK